jgi:hypothetical protein
MLNYLTAEACTGNGEFFDSISIDYSELHPARRVIAFAGFRLQTTCSAFMQGLLYPGSAGYVATGRG